MAAGGVCLLKGYYMKLDFSILIDYIPLFKSGLFITLKFTLLSLIVGFVLGFLLALIKVSKSKWLAPLRWFSDFYTSVFRGTPQLVQLFIIYYATPQLFNYVIPEIQAAVICFGLNSAAYISETLKGGILGIDKGQFEASKALGISYIRTMAFIILPQVLKITLPALVNESISLLKGSSLVSTIGVMDLMRASQKTVAATFHAFEPYIFVALIYYVTVMILTQLSKLLERKVRKSDSN